MTKASMGKRNSFFKTSCEIQIESLPNSHASKMVRYCPDCEPINQSTGTIGYYVEMGMHSLEKNRIRKTYWVNDV